jgi:filamentous hemagglutinin
VLSANTGAALIGAGLTGEDPAYPLLGATVGTFVGWGVGSLTRSGATWLGNVRPSTVNANYTEYWQTYGYGMSRYIPELELAAPYLGITVGNTATEFFSATVQDKEGN